MTASLLPSQTLNDRTLAMFGMAFGMSYLLYNYTEATFQGLNFLFVIFLTMAFEYQQVPKAVPHVSMPLRASKWSGPAHPRPAARMHGLR